MTVVLPALAVAFAAFCVWLTVRIINRRERWAKRTAAAVAISVLYVASFGPASWLGNRYEGAYPWYAAIYWPIGWIAVNSPLPVNKAIRRYAEIGRKIAPIQGMWMMPIGPGGDRICP